MTKANPPGINVRVLPLKGGWMDPESLDALKLVPGDKPMDGRFTTERIPPGQYKVHADVFLPEAGGGYMTGIRSPSFVGEALVTVPKEGLPEPVTIRLSKRGAAKEAN